MRFITGFIFAGMVAIVGGIYLIKTGYFPINADTTPSKIESFLAGMAVDAYVEKQIVDLKNPLPSSETHVAQGLKIYLNNCAGCHGSPTHTDSTFANALYPRAPQFAKDNPHLSEAEAFWITKHGIRFSAMPAFTTMLSDNDIWKVAMFLHKLDWKNAK